MSISRRTSVVALLLLPVLTLVACGGDTDGAAPNTGSSGAAVESTTTTRTGTAGGTGTGTMTIAGTDFAFEAEPCAIGGDDDQPSVEATGKGTSEGKDFTVLVKRSPSKTSVLENFQLVFSVSESMVGTNFVSLPDGADRARIKVEDTTATGSFEFLGTGGRPSGEGTFSLTCEG